MAVAIRIPPDIEHDRRRLLLRGSLEAARVILAHAEAGWFGDWHPAPARQFCRTHAAVIAQGCNLYTSLEETSIVPSF